MEALARAVLASTRIPRVVSRGTRAALSGFWLGVLSDDALRVLDERYYAGEDVYRSAGWNERGLFAWEQELIAGNFPAAGRVVVASCGGGREVLGLLREGRDAVGYEPHPALVAYAERFLAEHGHPSRVHPASRDVFPPSGAADAVIVGWGAYGLIHGRERRVSFLRGARSCLPAGAPLLLSFLQRPVHDRELRWTVALGNGLRRLRGAEQLGLGDTLAPNRVHVFTREELAEEVAAAGFEIALHAGMGQADDSTHHAAAVAIAA